MTEDMARKRREQSGKSDTEREEPAPPAEDQKPVDGDNGPEPTAPAPPEGPIEEPTPVIDSEYLPLPDLDEVCNACGETLHYIPINKVVRAVACINRSCGQYRERLRLVSLKKKPAKNKRQRTKK